MSGYDEGTLLDGTCRHSEPGSVADRADQVRHRVQRRLQEQSRSPTACSSARAGSPWRRSTAACWRTLTVTNITMRNDRRTRRSSCASAPGCAVPQARRWARLGGVIISNVVAQDVAGGPGDPYPRPRGPPRRGRDARQHPDRVSGRRHSRTGGRVVPEMEQDYPEPGSFGITPSWGLFARHAGNLVVHHVVLRPKATDQRPSVALDDVHGVEFEHASMTALPGDEDVRLAGCGGILRAVLPGSARRPARKVPAERAALGFPHGRPIAQPAAPRAPPSARRRWRARARARPAGPSRSAALRSFW